MHTNDTNSIRIRRQRCTPGFTLIELLVVIGVLGVLTSVAVGYSRRSEVVIALATDRAALASAFSRAKSLAIQTYQFPPGTPVPCGFGVRISNTGFTIFKDLPSGGATAPCGAPLAPFYNPPNETTPPNLNERFKEYTFDSRLALDLCYHASSPPNTFFCYSSNLALGLPEFEVLFVPPDPEVRFAQAEPQALVVPAPPLVDVVLRFYRKEELTSFPIPITVQPIGEVTINAAGQISTD